MLEQLPLKEKLAGKWGFSVGEETSDPDIVNHPYKEECYNFIKEKLVVHESCIIKKNVITL